MQKPPASRFILPLVLGCVIVISALAAFPSVREKFRDTLLPDSREILAKVEGDLTGQGDWVSVIKVKTRSDLIVEVYSMHPQPNESSLRARLVLPERKDGYFQLHGQPTNLALIDMNGDGILEIAAPTFDENLIPRLHIYRYDPQAQVFILASPDDK